MKEISIQSDYLSGEEVNTIYFGGGTPSLLPASDISRILSALHQHYNISPIHELTLEANPDDINPSLLSAWRNEGVNRLSIGVQSFFEDDLAWMNRAHNAVQAADCIQHALDTGFKNMSIDLIYGTPTLSDNNWEKNLETAVKFGVPHLSCYALTVEPGTALDVMTRKKKVMAVNNEDQARQFLFMCDYLQAKGYEHYEISNFALPGMRSIHNSSYWNNEKYLGLGPSAHSFNGTSRQWNIANNALYITSLKNGSLSFEIEMLTPEQKLNEYLMTSLRTQEGASLEYINQFGEEYLNEILIGSRKFVDRGWIRQTTERLILTREGKLFADGIASDLFISAKPAQTQYS